MKRRTVDPLNRPQRKFRTNMNNSPGRATSYPHWVFILTVAAILAVPATSSAQTALHSASAQSPAGGTIEGRVFNTRNGEFLENARLTIEGTSLAVLTDSTGQYRFLNVPVGVAKVRAFFTGLEVLTESVAVTGGSVM